MKLYQRLAQLAVSIQNCVVTNNQAWLNRHSEELEQLVRDHMPHGAGFDNGTTITITKSSDDVLLFYTAFHHMDEHGSYDGWTEHAIRVKPKLSPPGFSITVAGKDRNQIKDYIAETFDYALSQEITDA